MPNINKNIIKQAGAAVANATNKAAGLSASTPEPGTIISAIQLVNGGRTIGPAALAHFAESVRNKLLSLLVNMEPIQDLHGYDNPWPAGGGVNKFDIASSAPTTSHPYGFTISTDVNTGYVTIEGTYTGSGGVAFTIFPNSSVPSIANTTYYIVDANEDAAAHIAVIRANNTREGTGIAVQTTGTTNGETYNMVFRIMRVLSSEPAPTSWSPYSNICPISGRTGLDVYAGPTSAIGDTTTYSMDWTTPAGTVYAGSADIVTGDIKAAPYYASYNGETLVGPWISSMDAYDPEGTPTTGAQVVDLGGTMTEYHITGQDIVTLVGDNYIWSDSGDVTITE